MKILYKLLRLILFFSFLYGKPAFCEPQIKVAISHFPPVEMRENGQAVGINIDIMNALFAKLNLTPKYSQMPFKRCLLSLEKGHSDFIGSLQVSEDRKNYLYYIQPAYSEYHISFYQRKNETRELNKYEDLYQFKVGVIRAYKNFERFDNDNKIKKELVNSWESNYMKLVAGRVDVVIDDRIDGAYRVHMFDLKDQVKVAHYSFNAGSNGYFALSKKSKFYPRINEIEATLKQMLDSGEIESIIKNSLNKYQ